MSTDSLVPEEVKTGMTWLEFMRQYKPDITEEQCDYVLWEKTAFPCDTLEGTKVQVVEFLTRVNTGESGYELAFNLEKMLRAELDEKFPGFLE